MNNRNLRDTPLWFPLNFVLPESADEAAGGEGLLDEEGLGGPAAVQKAPVVDVALRMRTRRQAQEEKEERR